MKPKNRNKADFVTEVNIIKGVEELTNVPFYTGEAILNTLKHKPDHVGQIEVETEKQSTYEEMKDKSVRCAIWMIKNGITSSDIVVTCSGNHLDAYIPVFATFYLGAVYNAWGPYINLDNARYLMKLLTPKLLFTCQNTADLLLEAARLENVNTRFVVFGTHSVLQSLNDILRLQTKDKVDEFTPRKIVNPKELAVIALSSGTSGIPKGIMFSHESFLRNVYHSEISQSNYNIMWYATLNWLSGTLLTLLTLFDYGTRIIHVPNAGVPNAEETCKIIEKYKVNKLFLSPTLLPLFARSDVINTYDLSSLKIIQLSGSKLSQKVVEILQSRIPSSVFIETYGTTEFGRAIAHQHSKSENINSIGFIENNTKIKVADLKTGMALCSKEVGELCFKSPSMMYGYYKNPEATNQAFDKEGWLRSGDLGYYDEDGKIFILDRISELIKYKHHLLFPNEIEAVLLTNPAVIEVAVIPIFHEEDGEWPMAFVKKDDDSNLSELELIELSAALGEEKKIRGGIVFLENLPKTTSAKISRNELKLMAKELTLKRIQNKELRPIDISQKISAI